MTPSIRIQICSIPVFCGDFSACAVKAGLGDSQQFSKKNGWSNSMTPRVSKCSAWTTTTTTKKKKKKKKNNNKNNKKKKKNNKNRKKNNNKNKNKNKNKTNKSNNNTSTSAFYIGSSKASSVLRPHSLHPRSCSTPMHLLARVCRARLRWRRGCVRCTRQSLPFPLGAASAWARAVWRSMPRVQLELNIAFEGTTPS